MKPMVKKLMWITAIVLTIGLGVSAAADDGAFQAGPGGLRFKDLQLGEGPAAVEGQVATIHFVGWIDDHGARGKEIYNSRSQGRPVSFVIGTDGVMQGWNEGVKGMKPGGQRLLLVPPSMAWGGRAIDDVIPANAAMMFRIELISLENVSD
jgi:FKBP-type peptidyl-prolyl cis-trans isomerase